MLRKSRENEESDISQKAKLFLTMSRLRAVLTPSLRIKKKNEAKRKTKNEGAVFKKMSFYCNLKIQVISDVFIAIDMKE